MFVHDTKELLKRKKEIFERLLLPANSPDVHIININNYIARNHKEDLKKNDEDIEQAGPINALTNINMFFVSFFMDSLLTFIVVLLFCLLLCCVERPTLNNLNLNHSSRFPFLHLRVDCIYSSDSLKPLLPDDFIYN